MFSSHRGLLSEAILALEAAVLRDDNNSEAWRMLGVAHAENDDDKQVRGGDQQVRGGDKQVRGCGPLLSVFTTHTHTL